jgi:hypothetical protein
VDPPLMQYAPIYYCQPNNNMKQQSRTAAV